MNTHATKLFPPRLAKPRLTKPRLTKPLLAKPQLAKPPLATPPLLATPLLATAALGILLGALPAQDESRGFVLEPGDHDISEVIGKAAKFLGRNLIVQQKELIGNRDNSVTLQKTLNLDVTGCEEVVSQLAWMKGLVMSPVDPVRGIYEFINVRGPRRAEIRATFMAPEQVVKRPQLKILVSTSLRLKHIDAMRASTNLRPLMAAAGNSSLPLSIGNLGSRHALMLRGFADQVANAIGMLSMMDLPDAEGQQKGVTQRLANLEHQRTKLLENLNALLRRIEALEGKKKD